MIHFAAAYGLAQTIAACVEYCPTASRAFALKNKYGLRPKEIAEENGYSELSEELRDFEVVYLVLTLRWLNTVLRAVSGNSPDSECFNLDKTNMAAKK